MNSVAAAPAHPVVRTRPAAVLGAIGLVGFVVLTVLVLVHPAPLPLDRTLHRFALEHRDPVVGLVTAVTALGTGPVIVPLLLVAGVVAWRRTGVAWLVLAGPVLLVAGQAVRLTAMVLIDRPRPPAQDWTRFASGESFPSGHTTSAALTYGLLLLLISPTVRTRTGRVLLSVLLLVVAAAVGVSRVALGMHWPTDVLGGWCLASLLLPLFAMVLAAIGNRRERTAEASAEAAGA